MRVILYLFSFIFLFSCGSAAVKHSKVGAISFFDFQDRRTLFWSKAKYEDFGKKLKLWDKYVEGRFSSFYDAFIWSSIGERGDADERMQEFYKRITLHYNFTLYGLYEKDLVSANVDYRAKVKSAIHKYQTQINDTPFAFDVYLMPLGLTSNWGIATVGTYKGGVLKSVMILNTDLLNIAPGKLDSIILHELTHIDNFQQMGLRNYMKIVQSESYGLLDLLVLEGLGQYVEDHWGGDVKNFRGLDKLNRAMFDATKRLKEELNSRGILQEVEERMRSSEKLSTYGHCDRYLDVYEEIKFTCLDIYKLGAEMVSSYVEKASLRSYLALSREEKLEIARNYLTSNPSDVSKNILNHSKLHY